MRNNKTRRSYSSSEQLPGKCCNATMHGLHHWYTELFEKLGWMVLAKERGMTDKIKNYMNSLSMLKIALEQKMNKVNELDHKDDISIMLENVKILIHHSKSDFLK